MTHRACHESIEGQLSRIVQVDVLHGRMAASDRGFPCNQRLIFYSSLQMHYRSRTTIASVHSSNG